MGRGSTSECVIDHLPLRLCVSGSWPGNVNVRRHRRRATQTEVVIRLGWDASCSIIDGNTTPRATRDSNSPIRAAHRSHWKNPGPTTPTGNPLSASRPDQKQCQDNTTAKTNLPSRRQVREVRKKIKKLFLSNNYHWQGLQAPTTTGPRVPIFRVDAQAASPAPSESQTCQQTQTDSDAGHGSIAKS
jgi:hypothetical protein